MPQQGSQIQLNLLLQWQVPRRRSNKYCRLITHDPVLALGIPRAQVSSQ
jgi:hypothetical protein